MLQAGSEQSYPKNGDADKGGDRPDQRGGSGHRTGDAGPFPGLTGYVALLGIGGTGHVFRVVGLNAKWLSTVVAVDNRRPT